MLTCKDFLNELSDFLDENLDAELRRKLEKHITECPNCWVIADTTRKTVQIYKGMEPYEVPTDVRIQADEGSRKEDGRQAQVVAHLKFSPIAADWYHRIWRS